MKATFEESGGGRAPTPAARPDRPIVRAIGRGLRGRCPECGDGALFDGFLSVRPACAACGEPLHHHRADDLPPYLTILIVGHVVVTGLLLTERLLAPPIWLETIVWLTVTAALALALLRPLKGAVVALQWALFMHGFGRAEPRLPFPPKVS